MLGKYENTDRMIKEPSLEPVDVILPTLDAEPYLENCLDSLYREVPVNRVIVVDGGSKDKTIEIIKKYPRMEIHIRPDMRTTGKAYEFMLGRAATPWILFLDADITFPEGWYNDMIKHKKKYDFFGCKRIMRYEFFRVEPTSIDNSKRPMGAPWLAKKECFKNFHVDDDYAWRMVDILAKQVAEKSGYTFGKIDTTYHFHNTTENLMYESDKEKRGSRLIFNTPVVEITDIKNWEKRIENTCMATVKYLDPSFYPDLDNDNHLFLNLMKLNQDWIKNTNIKWYNELQKFKKKKYRKLKAKFFIFNTFNFFKKKFVKLFNGVMVNLEK
ncbi:MAG: glycosyltransferase family 2 protein [Candidatus Thermoplasmatota archaeon]|nr:glycosyltransferase family 2 protein [Candidatus Thermoplasmatota archaeon]